MPNVSCHICAKIFYAKPRHLKIGWGKFCSRKCQFKGQMKGNYFQCVECKKLLYRCPRDIKRSQGRFFCDKKCLMAWKNKNILSGENHARWKNGENAYRAIMLRRTAVPNFEKCQM